MSTHNGPEDPIPSPAEVIALVAEVLNEKNLSAIEGIAATITSNSIRFRGKPPAGKA